MLSASEDQTWELWEEEDGGGWAASLFSLPLEEDCSLSM